MHIVVRAGGARMKQLCLTMCADVIQISHSDWLVLIYITVNTGTVLHMTIEITAEECENSIMHLNVLYMFKMN